MVCDNWSASELLEKGIKAPKKASLLVEGNIILGGESTYRGATVVKDGGSITTTADQAIGRFSPTLVQGTLNLGDASNSIEQTFARPLRVGSTGLINEGKLSVTSLANFGNIEIESLNIHNGMKRILDALPDQTQPDQGSQNRSINAKAVSQEYWRED